MGLLYGADAPPPERPGSAPGNPPAAAPALVSLLKQYDALPEEERTPAKTDALATELIGQGAAIAPALTALLKDPLQKPAPSRSIVIRALTELDAKDSVPPLLEIAKRSPDYPLRQAALAALGKLGEPELLPSLVPLLELPEDRDHFEEQFKTTDAARAALVALARKNGGPSALQNHFSLVWPNAGESAKIRMIEVLRDVDSRETREMLSTCLITEMSSEVKKAVVCAFGYSNQPVVLNMLTGLLSSGEPGLKKEAIMALGRARYVPALPQLFGLIDCQEEGVRGNVLWALRNITGRPFESADQAKQWLDTQKQEEGKQFKTLTGKLTTVAPESLPLVVEQLGGLVLMRQEVEQAILPYVNSEDFRVRAAVCASLGGTGNLAVLVAKLRDSSKVVSFTAWRALQDATGKQLPRDYAQWQDWLER